MFSYFCFHIFSSYFCCCREDALGEEDWALLKKRHERRSARAKQARLRTGEAGERGGVLLLEEGPSGLDGSRLILTVARLCKMAMLFHVVGSHAEVARGVALMEEADFLCVCDRYPLSDDFLHGRFVTGWAGFINILKDISAAVQQVLTRHASSLLPN